MFFYSIRQFGLYFIKCFIVALPPAATKGSTQRRKGGHENKKSKPALYSQWVIGVFLKVTALAQ